MRKIQNMAAGLLGVILCVTVLVGVALAQQAPKAELTKTTVFNGSCTRGTLAVLSTAVATGGNNNAGINHNVRNMDITLHAAGYIIFYTTPVPNGAAVIGGFGGVADTQFKVTEADLGLGMRSGQGGQIYFDAPTGQVTITSQIRDDPQ